MKKNIKLTLVGVLTALASIGGAQAVLIDGAITFTGGIVAFRNAGGGNTASLAAATGVNNFSGVEVLEADGDFAAEGVSSGDAVTMAEPWIFTSPTPGLWSVGGFDFNLSSAVVLLQNANSIVVSGVGSITGPAGYDPTPGKWMFSTQSIMSAGEFSFSASSEAAGVPDGGASVALLGFSLLGLQLLRRKLRRA